MLTLFCYRLGTVDITNAQVYWLLLPNPPNRNTTVPGPGATPTRDSVNYRYYDFYYNII